MNLFTSLVTYLFGPPPPTPPKIEVKPAPFLGVRPQRGTNDLPPGVSALVGAMGRWAREHRAADDEFVARRCKFRVLEAKGQGTVCENEDDGWRDGVLVLTRDPWALEEAVRPPKVVEGLGIVLGKGGSGRVMVLDPEYFLPGERKEMKRQ